MPKTKISEYSTTNSANTDIESINIDEGCAPSGINNAIRELMVHLKEFQTGASGDPLTVAGTFVASGGATIAASAGTSASPSIHFSSDTNTGIFSPAADTIAFAEGGVEVMRIASDGKVYIGGTTAGTFGLRVFAASDVAEFVATDAGANGAQIRLFHDSASPAANDVTSLIDFAGRDSGGNATIYSRISGIATSVTDTSESGAIAFSTRNTGTFAERMRIDTSGNVGIGTSSPSYRFVSLGGRIQLGGGTTAQEGIAIQRASGYASITGINHDNNAYNALAFATGASEAMRIDTSGNVGIGTASTVATATTRVEVNAASSAYNLSVSGSLTGYLYADSSAFGLYGYANVALVIKTNNTERMRIDTSGNLLVAKTALSTATVGCELLASGIGIFTASADSPLIVNRNTNDGTLVDLRQANTTEGTISVSGTTVSYNGGHLSRWAQMPGTKDDTLVKGTVMSNLDEMNVYTKDGEPVENEQLNKVKVSDVEGDVNVAGVFVNWTYDDAHQVDEINMAMTGDMIIRIAQGVIVQKGDLLMSAGDGTAKPQGDDIVRSKTVAKVTSNHVTCTYADGSYCVPCVLMAC
jgi:hypothetical protein